MYSKSIPNPKDSTNNQKFTQYTAYPPLRHDIRYTKQTFTKHLLFTATKIPQTQKSDRVGLAPQKNLRDLTIFAVRQKMLVLTRKKNESIIIGDDIQINILQVTAKTVRLGISAPNEISVHRKEIYDKILEQKTQNEQDN